MFNSCLLQISNTCHNFCAVYNLQQSCHLICMTIFTIKVTIAYGGHNFHTCKLKFMYKTLQTIEYNTANILKWAKRRAITLYQMLL